MGGVNRRFFFLLGVTVFLAGVSGQAPPTNTPAPTTTSTTPPTTTSTTPPTTTTKATTTTALTTTTGKPSSTTPKPTPTPKYPANEGRWVLVDENTNVTCIMMKGAIEISVTYVDKNNTNHTENVDIPKTAVATGNCTLGTIVLTWKNNSLQLVFEANETMLSLGDSGISGGKFALQDVIGSLDAESFVDYPNPTTPYTFSIKEKAAFQTPLNHSYSCLVQETLQTDDGHVVVKLSDIRMEAFMKGTQGHSEFSAAIDCPADDASDTVPIAVGAALAGLVVIVLIAYLIGRRRSRARGYQSV